MILLKKVRLINWYGFSNVTAPIGFFTLIAGKNGNGKSVMLDGIKYAAYGDTVFNKSSESKGSRTLSSYTRGLLDATANTYMRPADQVPNVYSHIVLEYFDDVEDKFFLLGTVIETSPSNNCQSYRYVVDHASMDQMEHTYEEKGVIMPASPSYLQKKYRLTLMNREQGLPKFLQMTGLKLSLSQLPTYLRKLRGMMSYDPDARIDQFIRESVLEERNVDFGKLIAAKENIERLNENFSVIEQEIQELNSILEEYDSWETEKNRLLTDDVRIVYKRIKDMTLELERQEGAKEQAERTYENLEKELEILNSQKEELASRIVSARVSLSSLDTSRMVEEEKRRLKALEGEKQELLRKCKELEHFQTVVSQMMAEFFQEDEDRRVLSSLCQFEISPSEKEAAVFRLKQKVQKQYDRLVKQIGGTEDALKELGRRLDSQHSILEECKKHQNSFQQIPDYVGLRDEINREFEKRGIPSKARFACEYVISLRDESWRDAIEGFLGPRRYTILVEPEYYDIADDVLNRSEHRYAHLFNTKLLMEKEVRAEEDSAVFLLEIKHPVAKQYFTWQLGRIHAVKLGQVRRYENAISREGRVSVAMDSYFLRFDRIRAYYLGQKVFELNRKRAEKEIARLNEEKGQVLMEKRQLEQKKNSLAQEREFFREYDYSAHLKYQTAAENSRELQKRVKELEASLKNNREYMELVLLVEQLSKEQEAVLKEYEGRLQKRAGQGAVMERCKERIQVISGELVHEKETLKQYQTEYYTIAQRAVEGYEKYLENGKKGAGGLLAPESRSRMSRSLEQHKSELLQRQADYNVRHSGNMLPRGTEGREKYSARRDQIWMDDLQEIRQKLADQTRRYEDIFKNEFVLTILKSCERAREDLRQINGELAKLQFAAKYQFDVHYVRDGSQYAKVIQYARYLDEREQLGGGDGQMTLGTFTSISDEEGEQLEKEMQQIINGIIEKNSEEVIARFADYRNYMTYEILVTNSILDRAKLSRQTGFNSGAEVQIPYLLILSSALLLIYNQRVNSTRLVFIDEPFAKMDPGNVKLMLDFMREQKLQVIFCSPDKTESIGNECEVILPALRVRPDSMQLGIIQFHEQKAYERG